MDPAVRVLLDRARRKAGDNPMMLQVLKEQILDAGSKLPGGPAGPEFPEEKMLTPEQLDILGNIKQGGYSAETHQVPFSKDMMSDAPSRRIKVTRPGFPGQSPGEFPLSGLTDVGGEFAMDPTSMSNPVMMAAIKRFLQASKEPQIPLDEMDIRPTNPYEGIGFDLTPPKRRLAGK